MDVRNETEKRILSTMEEMGFPESVKTTVIWATRKAPDREEATSEVEAILKKLPTGKELTRAVQKYIRGKEKPCASPKGQNAEPISKRYYHRQALFVSEVLVNI